MISRNDDIVGRNPPGSNLPLDSELAMGDAILSTRPPPQPIRSKLVHGVHMNLLLD